MGTHLGRAYPTTGEVGRRVSKSPAAAAPVARRSAPDGFTPCTGGRYLLTILMKFFVGFPPRAALHF